MVYSETLRKIVRKWPGRKYLREYSFLPAFFFFGAALEYVMIKWNVGEVNFYKVYKRRQVQNIVERKLLEETKVENQA